MIFFWETNRADRFNIQAYRYGLKRGLKNELRLLIKE